VDNELTDGNSVRSSGTSLTDSSRVRAESAVTRQTSVHGFQSQHPIIVANAGPDLSLVSAISVLNPDELREMKRSSSAACLGIDAETRKRKCG